MFRSFKNLRRLLHADLLGHFCIINTKQVAGFGVERSRRYRVLGLPNPKMQCEFFHVGQAFGSGSGTQLGYFAGESQCHCY